MLDLKIDDISVRTKAMAPGSSATPRFILAGGCLDKERVGSFAEMAGLPALWGMKR